MNKTDVIINKPFLIKENIENSSEVNLENYLEQSLGDKEIFEKVKSESSILINGIEFDLRTPLIFLYFNFSYLDGFLYITIN